MTRRVTKRPGYREAVYWIAVNDNPGDPMYQDSAPDGPDEIAGYVSTLLVADLFGADPELVAKDVDRVRRKEFKR